MDKYIIFNIGESKYGIKILSINRILTNQEIFKVPEMPINCMGVTTVREELWNIFDMNYLLYGEHTADRENPTNKIILMADTTESKTGFLVGASNHILEIDSECIEKTTFDDGEPKYVAKINTLSDGKENSEKSYNQIIVLLTEEFLARTIKNC